MACRKAAYRAMTEMSEWMEEQLWLLSVATMTISFGTISRSFDLVLRADENCLDSAGQARKRCVIGFKVRAGT